MFCRLLAAAGLLLLSAAAAAEPFVFATNNQATLARFAALPTPQADATGSGARLTADWTNEFVLAQRGSESLLLDGETLRVALSGRWAWRGWLFGAELPLLMDSGGVLDAPIENWHRLFSMPNGGRNLEPRNQYQYRYQRNGQVLVDLTQGKTGVGDARLYAAYCADGGCWRSMLQLPSGDRERLMGGGLGGAAWYEQAYTLGQTRWSGALAAGVSGVRRAGPLEDLQHGVLPFGWASLGYALTPRLDAGAQLYLHRALYKDSQIPALTRPGGQLAFGLRYRPTPQTAIWFGAQEDVIVDSSPDFSIHFSADWH